MDIKLIQKGKHLIVTVVGRIDLSSSNMFKQEITRLSDGAYPSIVVDLSEVTYFDSTAIGTLVSANSMLQKLNCSLAVMNVPANIRGLLKLSTIDKLMIIYDSINDLE